MKILMVCLGNICRSPLAHGIMQHMADERGLNWEIDSAGTGSWHLGSAPHRLSQKVAREKGVDISGQRARQLASSDFTYYDLILFMDKDNKADGKAIAGEKWTNTKTALLLDSLANSHQPSEVPDPYFGGEDGFYAVYALISNACKAWIDKLQRQQTTTT